VGENLPLYYARHLQMECGVEGSLTWELLEWFCWKKRGIWLKVEPEFPDLGAYLPWPYKLIVLDADATELVLAHELYHELIQERRGVTQIHTYGYGPRAQEADANCFAHLVVATRDKRRRY
jgi:hypothetical protein